jgi:anti-sigma factor RsiW
MLGEKLMSCRDTIHLICMYLEGKLSPGVQAEIERHLGSCPDCRLVLNAATTTLDRYFGAPKITADSQAA